MDHADSMVDTMKDNKKKLFGALRKVNIVTHPTILRKKNQGESIAEQEETN